MNKGKKDNMGGIEEWELRRKFFKGNEFGNEECSDKKWSNGLR